MAHLRCWGPDILFLESDHLELNEAEAPVHDLSDRRLIECPLGSTEEVDEELPQLASRRMGEDLSDMAPYLGVGRAAAPRRRAG